MSRVVFYKFCNYVLAFAIGTISALWAISYERVQADKQTLLSVAGEMNAEIAIRDSKIEDLCTAIDMDKDNFRTSCKDIMDANDRGEGRITK